MRGRPSSSSGTGSTPVTRPDSSAHTGRAPRRARASAMSSPWVRMAAVPHTTSPTEAGHSPVSLPVAVADGVGQRPADVPRRPGRQRLRVDRVEVPPRRQHVRHAPGRRPRRPRRHVPPVQRPQACSRSRRWSLQRGNEHVAGEPQRFVDRSSPSCGRPCRRSRFASASIASMRPMPWRTAVVEAAAGFGQQGRRSRPSPSATAAAATGPGPGGGGAARRGGRSRASPSGGGRGCGGRRGSGRPSVRRGSRRGGGGSRRSRRRRGRRRSGRGRGRGRPARSSSQIWARRAGSLAGSRVDTW